MTKAQEYLVKELSLFYSFEEFDKERFENKWLKRDHLSVLLDKTKGKSIIFGYNAMKPEKHMTNYYYDNELVSYNKNFQIKFNEIYNEPILIKQPNSEIDKVNFYIAGYMIDYVSFNGEKAELYRVNSKKILEGISIAVINFDFNIEDINIKIHFKNDISKPFTIAMKTEKYIAPPIDYNKLYLENMEVKHALGQDLINIYFKKCNDNYKKTKIELYVKANQEYQLMGEYEVEKGMFFKTINGLAYGNYAYKLIQYDDKDKEIISTDFNEFKLSVPNYR